MANSIFIIDAYKGLGTAWWVELFLRDDEKVEVEAKLSSAKLQQHLENTITEFEKKYSRFKDDSLLNKLNTQKTVPYDKDLAIMLNQAQKVSLATNNVFSIFIKDALEEKGYGKKSHTESVKIDDAGKCSAVIDATTITLTGNKGIDLGGIGKGYLIDKLATILIDDYNLPHFLINGGGDIYVTSDHGKEVEIFLEHPVNEGEYFNKILIKDSAFCSSSSFKRKWTKDGKVVNHFIADREIWSASYILGEDATTTDMHATVFCILANEKEKLDPLATISHLEYVVIDDTGKMLISKGFPAFLE